MSNFDGGPAFPSDNGHSGMTLRDYFAAAALQVVGPFALKYEHGPDNVTAAKRAYDIADAMLAERARGRG